MERQITEHQQEASTASPAHGAGEAKRELRLHALVAPTQTVVVSAYDEAGVYLGLGQTIAEAFKTGAALKRDLTRTAGLADRR